jgi:SAM-dependent methyltransferase
MLNIVAKYVRALYSRSLSTNSSRFYLEKWIQRAADSLGPGAMVLDAGSGKGIYSRLFDHVTYESADFCKVEKAYSEQTYVCDLKDIPVEDARYDLVLCTQVLEHIPEPELVLRELHRVLKPGGFLWLSAPFFYEEHEKPYDFYRYTQFGLEHLFSKAGFKVVEIEWLEGYFGTLSYQLALASNCLPVASDQLGTGFAGYLRALLMKALKLEFSLLSRFFANLDIANKYRDAGMCKNYCCVCIKDK